LPRRGGEDKRRRPAWWRDLGKPEIELRVLRRIVAATGESRLAGTSNFKVKYAGNFPKVAILDAAPGRITTSEALESLGLVAPPEPAPAVVRSKSSRNHSRPGTDRGWPDYEACVKNAPPAKEGGPDRSLADFFWCLMAAQRGHSIEDTANKLVEVSEKAQERARLHDEGYALITAQNAAAAAERGRKRGRG
jgi:hypothetical protein